MGKSSNGGNNLEDVEQNGERNGEGCDVSRVCNRSALKMILAVIVSVNVLLVGIYSFPMLMKHNGRHHKRGHIRAPVQATFTLERPLSTISAHILELESDILAEISVPNAKVKIMSLRSLAESNGTKVVFGVVPNGENSSISSVSLSVLKATFVTLVLKTYNLTLAPSLFGRAYFFEVLKFPGGITVVPEQAHFPLLKMQVLFNFTLPNSIVQVVQNLDQLKQELKSGLLVRPNENLFVQLTNLEGSTMNIPTIIETSVMPVVGTRLATPRLKQLAQEITGNHSANLGLNHTVFGEVHQIMLSSYLKDPTSPSPASSPAPSPSPSEPACSPMSAPLSSPPAPDVPDTHYHHAMAPSHHGQSPHHSHPLLHCRHHHASAHSKCRHPHHARHVPVHGVHGSPSPAPSPSREKPYIHHHVSVAPSPVSLPPRSSPLKAGPCYSHLPSSPLVSPSPAPSPSGSRAASHSARPPTVSAAGVSTPKFSPPTVLTNASPPASGQAHAGHPLSHFSPPSSSFSLGPSIQLVTWSVLLVGILLACFLP